MMHRTIFAVVYVLAVLSLVWPVYAWFSGIYPLVLGLPLSFAWVVGWLIVMFVAMVGLFVGDYRRRGS